MTNQQKAQAKLIETNWEYSMRNDDIKMSRLDSIKWLAENDIWPDGDYSDNECIVWSWFHESYLNRK